MANASTRKFVGKVAVMNFSGNVGKSTVAKHLLMPRMEAPEYVPVESINADEGEGDTVRGKQWGQLQEELMLLDSAVVDVGASNVEDFMRLLDQYRGSHEEFDLFVIPVVAESKQIRDTLATIDALHYLGVPAKKIRVVFNRVEVDEQAPEVFYPIFNAHKKNPTFTLREDAVIEFSEIYQRLRALHKGVDEVLADKTDWRAELKAGRKEGDQEKQDKAISMITVRRLAVSAQENLDTVFAAMMAPAK